MNSDQVNGIIRNLVMALAALISTLNLCSSEILSHITAVTIAFATLVWSFCDPGSRNLIGTLIRRLVQAAAPLCAALGWLTPEQAAAATAFALVVVATIDGVEKRQ